MVASGPWKVFDLGQPSPGRLGRFEQATLVRGQNESKMDPIHLGDSGFHTRRVDQVAARLPKPDLSFLIRRSVSFDRLGVRLCHRPRERRRSGLTAFC